MFLFFTENMLGASVLLPPVNCFCFSPSYLVDVLKELDDAYERYRRESDSLQRRKLQLSIQRALIRSQELGDEKIQIAGQMVRREHPAAVSVEMFRWKTSSDCSRIEKSFHVTYTHSKLL